MYAIFDCDNCFVSCERIFRPELADKPVVVLSNNDGCVVARSKEAKTIGIKMGMPYFKLKETYPEGVVSVFSGNHELYRDITRRVMDMIENAVPEFHRYSIDEAFCVLDGMDRFDLKGWGEDLSAKIKRWTGMPVSVGIAATKTLAKCADRFAKDYPGYNKCCIIDSDEKTRKALELFPINEVWGIGRRFKARLELSGIKTAHDFVQKPRSWVQKEFHLSGERTWLELQGKDCIPTDHNAANKSICVSRSFPEMITDFTSMRTHVSNFAAQCSGKLRRQHNACSRVTVFIDTNRFRPDLPQHNGSFTMELLTPDNSTQGIVKTAVQCLENVFRANFCYKRAGVTLSGISEERSVQTNFLDFDATLHTKLKKLDKIVDSINEANGCETIVLGSQQYIRDNNTGKATSFRDTMRHQFRSNNFTTRWQDIVDTERENAPQGFSR